MTINCKCPSCGREYDLKEEHAGQQVRCANCKSIFTVPSGLHPVIPDDGYEKEPEIPDLVEIIEDRPESNEALTHSTRTSRQRSQRSGDQRRNPRRRTRTGSSSTNSKSIVAFVCGIVGLVTCFIVSIFAIVYGNQALQEIRKSNEPGEGLAIAGLVLGYISLVLNGIGLILLILIRATVR